MKDATQSLAVAGAQGTSRRRGGRERGRLGDKDGACRGGSGSSPQWVSSVHPSVSVRGAGPGAKSTLAAAPSWVPAGCPPLSHPVVWTPAVPLGFQACGVRVGKRLLMPGGPPSAFTPGPPASPCVLSSCGAPRPWPRQPWRCGVDMGAGPPVLPAVTPAPGELCSRLLPFLLPFHAGHIAATASSFCGDEGRTLATAVCRCTFPPSYPGLVPGRWLPHDEQQI